MRFDEAMAALKDGSAMSTTDLAAVLGANTPTSNETGMTPTADREPARLVSLG